VDPDEPRHVRGVREALTRHVLPSWAKRAGPDAREVFNRYLAPHTGLTLP